MSFILLSFKEGKVYNSFIKINNLSYGAAVFSSIPATQLVQSTPSTILVTELLGSSVADPAVGPVAGLSADPVDEPLDARIVVAFAKAAGVTSPARKLKNLRAHPAWNGDKGFKVQPSMGEPGYVVLPEKQCVLVMQQRLGHGAQSDVFKVSAVDLSGDPSNCDYAMKLAKMSFSPEFHLLKKTRSCINCNNLDLIQEKHSLKFGEYIGLYELSECSLKGFDYQSIDKPVQFLVGQLLDVAEGLQKLHQDGICHRDVKGDNILINRNGKGKLTDFGISRNSPLDGKPHPVALTPPYAAPFIDRVPRGNKPILYLATNNGYQDFTADLFAFGRTLQYDVILPLLKFMAKEHAVDLTQIFEPMKKRIIDGAPEGEDFKQIGCAVYNHRSNRSCLMPTSDILLTQTTKALEALRAHLAGDEFQQLQMLQSLAICLQNNNPEAIPSIEEVQTQLKKIQHIAERQDTDRLDEALTKKRRL
jgi:serine/threonine protein kinase